MNSIKQFFIHFILAFRPLFRVLFPEAFRRKVRTRLYRSENQLVLSQTAAPENLQPGIMMYGMFSANTGMGSAARLLANGCLTAGVDCSLGLIQRENAEGGKVSEPFAHYLTTDNFQDTNLFVFNADSVEFFLRQIGAGVLKGRYNIAHWSWELPEFPDYWQEAFSYFDEFWTISEFCRKAIASKTDKPVRVVRYGITANVNPRITRKDFGLPGNRLLFLCMADANSVLARKNPLGALRAYCRAFPDGTSTGLVIKISGGEHESDVLKMKKVAQQRTDIFFIRENLSAEQTHTLISLCDVFVSLHRAEGFGLPIAEAMLLGKSVIVTGWSGNMDFTNAENACCVNYSLLPVGENAVPPYDHWQLWAEPDIDDAVRYMRTLAESSELREKLGEAARSKILTDYSPESCGRDIMFNLRYSRSR